MTGSPRDDSRARAYAAWARSGADASFAPTLAAVVELLPSPPCRLLDVGCGEGRVGRALVERGHEVVGVDADETMADLADAVVADACALPFPAGDFDAVVSAHALMEIGELDAAVAEIARVLRSGGVLVAVIEHPFSSGRRVDRYSEEARYGWGVSHGGVDLELGGIHRPLGRYVQSLERAGLALDTLRELTVGSLDPLSLALRARRR